MSVQELVKRSWNQNREANISIPELFPKRLLTDGTDRVGPPSSACPSSDSRSSRLRSRSRCSKSRTLPPPPPLSLLLSLERSRSRVNGCWPGTGSRSSGIGSSGLRPCCLRYSSELLVRFWGGGAGVESSGSSHGNEVEV